MFQLVNSKSANIENLLLANKQDINSKLCKGAIRLLILVASPQDIPLLIKILTLTNDLDIRYDLGYPLLQMGQDAVPALVNALPNVSTELRKYMIGILETIGDSAATPGLIDMLSDPDVFVRAKAIKALKTLKDTRAVPALIEKLSDNEIVEELDEYWPGGPKTIRVSNLAAWTLEDIGTPEALEAVEKYQKKPPSVRVTKPFWPDRSKKDKPRT